MSERVQAILLDEIETELLAIAHDTMDSRGAATRALQSLAALRASAAPLVAAAPEMEPDDDAIDAAWSALRDFEAVGSRSGFREGFRRGWVARGAPSPLQPPYPGQVKMASPDE